MFMRFNLIQGIKSVNNECISHEILFDPGCIPVSCEIKKKGKKTKQKNKTKQKKKNNWA